MNNAAHEHLVETWGFYVKAATWLSRSHWHSPVPPFAEASDAEWDQLGALAGRFARLTDLIIHKFLRALDRYELEDTATLLDSANRSERRGLVASAGVLREFKDLRNEIVHEYSTDDLASLYEDIYSTTPDLLELFSRIEIYLSNNHLIEPGSLR